MKNLKINATAIVILMFVLCSLPVFSQEAEQPIIDQKVKAFLKERGRWHDMNVPTSDGQLLYNLILDNNYRSVLEIGTSTGHSTIWMAYALSKTGGKLITIEIDENRHLQALANFEEAGVAHLIDARLADAHKMVQELEGPFDFVFSDADKGWYRNYFEAVDPKLKVNGCYTTHNISDRPGGWNSDYLEFLMEQENYKTSVNSKGGGMAISFKKAK